MEKQLKYSEELQKSPEEILAEDLLYDVEIAEQSVRSVITKTRKAYNDKKKQLAELFRSRPFDYKRYSDIEEEMIQFELGLEKAEKFLKERF